MSWTNNATNATNVLIDRSTDGVNFTQIASVSPTVTTYHDTSLSPGTTYYYKVQATNAAGNSPFSNVFQAATLTSPAPPTNLAATNITTTEVDLSWTNVATNATGIKILDQLGNNSSTGRRNRAASHHHQLQDHRAETWLALSFRSGCPELERTIRRGNPCRGYIAWSGQRSLGRGRTRRRSPSAGPRTRAPRATTSIGLPPQAVRGRRPRGPASRALRTLIPRRHPEPRIITL